ncbi:serpin family protein [Kutzneria viridogrisea]|uniref:Serpin B n=1 Tax=Kutzneria viridogrisea TaxID=47990 RepID=A0ABR6BLM5_9PSEU|nr:serpin B [Kutzneria viridogrisea]
MDLAFTLALHRAVDPDPDNDLCWSPYSVASALGLTATGAEGATRTELVTALLGAADGDLGAHAALLTAASELDEWHRGEQPVLVASNTLWAVEDLPIRREFAGELARWPGGAVRGAPFTDAPEDARKLINTDVAETTRGLIPELIPPQAILPDTVAALVNALYLKAAWQHEFAEQETEDRPFRAPTGTYYTPTMRLTQRLGYAHERGWQVVTLPAAGGVEAVVLLPDAPLIEAEPALDAAALSALVAAPSSVRIQLSLPKLSASTRASLKRPLVEMGVQGMFRRGEAGLTRLCPDPRLYVDDVLHESVLKIDEKGLEGAAATAVTMRMMSMAAPSDPVVVDVDRPFLLVIRHRETGVPYFVARVVHPQ